MYLNNKIGVVIPTYNEEEFIASVIDTVPNFVDKIYVVDDASTDNTLKIIWNTINQNNRVTVIQRKVKGGVGASILSGHRRALQDKIDILAVMAGDGQMDPILLSNIIKPVAEGNADYSKGDRLSNREHRKEMPIWRIIGNFILTWLTRIASGYSHVSDPQNGYSAILVKTLKKLDLDRIEPGFPFENDLLVKLNVINARVVDVKHPALYRGQHSKIRYPEFIIRTSCVLLKDFIWRIWVKYIRKTSLNNPL